MGIRRKSNFSLGFVLSYSENSIIPVHSRCQQKSGKTRGREGEWRTTIFGVWMVDLPPHLQTIRNANAINSKFHFVEFLSNESNILMRRDGPNLMFYKSIYGNPKVSATIVAISIGRVRHIPHIFTVRMSRPNEEDRTSDGVNEAHRRTQTHLSVTLELI